MFAPIGRLTSLALALGVASAAGCSTNSEATTRPTSTPAGGAGGNSNMNTGSAACPSLGVLKAPTVPAQLEPPAGATLMLRYRAQGAQIYACKVNPAATGAATYVWTFKAPDAKLSDESCTPAGTHFAGPTWKSSLDDSTVVGTKLADAPSPSAGAIPWLLLKAASTTGNGIMNSVVAVQRVDTAGGAAPADGCDASTLGAERSVPYSAVYYFYKGAY
jgi:hypothetical protein